MSFSRYDIWKTSNPYDESDIIAGECHFCKSNLYHGDEVYYDSRDETNFCDKECFVLNEKDKLEEHIERLEENKNIYETVIETEEEDD